MTTGIYRITHILSNRFYIGQAVNIERRWSAHKRMLDNNKHHAFYLQSVWNKYGATAFVFEIVEVCNIEDLDAREQLYLDQMPKFNTALTAQTRRGVRHSEETRARIGAAHRGQKRSPKACANISAGLRGLKASCDAKAKMSAAKIGRKLSEDCRKNMSVAQSSRPRSPAEYDSRRGRKRDCLSVQKSAEKRRGCKRTAKQVAKMKAAAAMMSPEKRAKIAQARRDAFANRAAKQIMSAS